MALGTDEVRVMSRFLCKKRFGASVVVSDPALIDFSGDAIDSSFDALVIVEAAHGRGSSSDFPKSSLYRICGTHRFPEVFWN